MFAYTQMQAYIHTDIHTHVINQFQVPCVTEKKADKGCLPEGYLCDRQEITAHTWKVCKDLVSQHTTHGLPKASWDNHHLPNEGNRGLLAPVQRAEKRS